MFYRHRMYSAQNGRFVSRDPLGYVDGPSLYRAYYAPNANDPDGLALYAFDGTANYTDPSNPLVTVDGGGGTNVAKMFHQSYIGKNKFYAGGIGNRVEYNALMQKIGGAFGLGASDIEAGMLVQLDKAVMSGDTSVDVIGFSRGAAEALDFLHLVQGYAEATCREDVKIRFVGLFDAVGSFGLTGSNNPSGKSLFLTTGKWRPTYTAHAVAMNETRSRFQVIDVVGANIQQAFKGAHSDIGGGYNKTGLSDISLQWMIERGSQAGAPFVPIAGLHPDPNMLPHREFSLIYSHKTRELPNGLVNPDNLQQTTYKRVWDLLHHGVSEDIWSDPYANDP